MSYDSWLHEFMPVPVYEATDSALEALQHSKRKWLGLRPEALRRHEGKLDYKRLAFKGASLHIDTESCALCCKYLFNDDTCTSCPLYKLRNLMCDEGRPDSPSPFTSFLLDEDPEPMIELIDRAIEKESSK